MRFKISINVDIPEEVFLTMKDLALWQTAWALEDKGISRD